MEYKIYILTINVLLLLMYGITFTWIILGHICIVRWQTVV